MKEAVIQQAMRIAVTGKGGSGKTILAGTLARVFDENGVDVLAIDDDHDPDLAVSLGIPHSTDIPPLSDDLITRAETSRDEPAWEITRRPRSIVDEYGISAPGGVTLLRSCGVIAEGGHMGRSHATVAVLLADDGWARPPVTIVDMTAGLEVYGMLKYVDVLAVVVQPYYKSLETVNKLNTFARAYDVPDVRVIANNVRNEAELNRIEEYCADKDLDVAAVIPNDYVIHKAELCGTSPVDIADESSGVEAIRGLAGALTESTPTPDPN